MTTLLTRISRLVATLVVLASASGYRANAEDAPAQPAAFAPLSPEVASQTILAAMQRVADCQLANQPKGPLGWIPAVGDIGMMALAGVSGDAKYRDALLAKGETNGWAFAKAQNRYHADNQCIGQVWAELHLLYRKPSMLAPMREQFDWILANPSVATSLDYSAMDSKTQELWSWCDALFMAPPTLLRLYSATGDERYLNHALAGWWRTTDFLYDREDHLFFRDGTFIAKRDSAGKKFFWSRGNGWVFAATVRMLQYLPANHPDQPRFEKLFREMAAKILSCQQADGLWRASLLNQEAFPLGETSGSSLFTYGLAWGVNQGLLDRATVAPAVRKAWVGLVGCVTPEGRVTHVQPAGMAPGVFKPESSLPYGVGGFLLAGSEVYRMAVLETAKSVTVRVSNPASFRRESETVEIFRSAMLPKELAAGKVAVMDGTSARILDSQLYASNGDAGLEDALVFQVDLAPGETRTYRILSASALAAEPSPIVKTFARQVPERLDDFAWESDRIAHRMYSLKLIPAEHTISSSPDVWIKKDRGLVVNRMYRSNNYHKDNGECMDDYRVGSSRGCGGLGIWDGQKLYSSSNYSHCRVITSGPVRSVFELTYDAWDVGGGRKVSEVKRISIDAGSWFTKMESTFSSDDHSSLTIGVGLAERACGPDGKEQISQDQTEGWMTYWQPEDKPKGVIAVAFVLPKGSVKAFTNDNPNLSAEKIHAPLLEKTIEGTAPIRSLLAISQAEIGKPYQYYIGASWDRSGDFTSPQQWAEYVNRVAERRDQPLRVTIGSE